MVIKFPPSRAGKDIKYPGYAPAGGGGGGGMLKLRFDYYITLRSGLQANCHGCEGEFVRVV